MDIREVDVTNDAAKDVGVAHAINCMVLARVLVDIGEQSVTNDVATGVGVALVIDCMVLARVLVDIGGLSVTNDVAKDVGVAHVIDCMVLANCDVMNTVDVSLSMDETKVIHAIDYLESAHRILWRFWKCD